MQIPLIFAEKKPLSPLKSPNKTKENNNNNNNNKKNNQEASTQLLYCPKNSIKLPSLSPITQFGDPLELGSHEICLRNKDHHSLWAEGYRLCVSGLCHVRT